MKVFIVDLKHLETPWGQQARGVFTNGSGMVAWINQVNDSVCCTGLGGWAPTGCKWLVKEVNQAI